MKLSDGFQTSALKKNSFLPPNILSFGTDTTGHTVFLFIFFKEIATVWPKIFYWNSYKYCDINLSDYNGFLSKSFIFLMFVSNDVTCREYLGLLCILSSSTLCQWQLQQARKLLRQSGKVNGHWHSHNKSRAENNLCRSTLRWHIFNLSIMNINGSM